MYFYKTEFNSEEQILGGRWTHRCDTHKDDEAVCFSMCSLMKGRHWEDVPFPFHSLKDWWTERSDTMDHKGIWRRPRWFRLGNSYLYHLSRTFWSERCGWVSHLWKSVNLQFKRKFDPNICSPFWTFCFSVNWVSKSLGYVYPKGCLENAAIITSKNLCKITTATAVFFIVCKSWVKYRILWKKISYRKVGCSVFRNYESTIVKVG